MGVEIAFAKEELVDLEVHGLLIDGHGADSDVGHDTDALNRDVAGREVLRHGELQRRVVLELVQDLHRALAEALLADDQRAIVILERAGHDFARGRAHAIDQQDDGVARLGPAPLGVLFGALARVLRGRRHDGAVVEEGVGNLHRLIEKAARVAAEVEDEPHHALLVQVGQGLAEVALRVALEVLDFDVADVVAEHAVLDGGNRDSGAGELDTAGVAPLFGLVLSANEDFDLGAGRAAQAIDRLLQGHVERRLRVDLHDAVSALQARLGRRRVGDRFDHREEAVAK